jgi:hypothetical protein
MIVGTIQQEDDISWQKVDSSWMELGEEGGNGDYCVGMCQESSKQTSEAGDRSPGKEPFSSEEEEEGEEDKEFMKDGWWTPSPDELQVKEEEREYVIELLMGGSTQNGAGATPGARPPVGGMAGQPEGGATTTGPGAQEKGLGEIRNGGLKTSKGKGERSKESPSGKGVPSSEAGTGGGQPDSRGQEESPRPATDLGPGSTSRKPAGDPGGESGQRRHCKGSVLDQKKPESQCRLSAAQN